VSGIDPVNSQLRTQSPEALLRQRVGELIGVAFFSKLLAQARQSFVREDSLFSAGPGQEALEARLHEQFALQVGKAVGGRLQETIVRRLLRQTGGDTSGG
jgi:hypothetical protein